LDNFNSPAVMGLCDTDLSSPRLLVAATLCRERCWQVPRITGRMEQVPLTATSRADSDGPDATHSVLPDVAVRRIVLANVVWLGTTTSSDWVLVDAGVPGSAAVIARTSEERFGTPPAAILLTHGHFDHVGALESLADKWNVPIYAHELEFPYLNGTAAYPPPDPSVGGLMSALSPFYPREPVDVSRWLKPLPADGSVPHLTGWRWLASPGHTPGHVSLWRPSDRTLIAGDAVITTRQESAYAVMTQTPEMHGPPAYFTQDWTAAERSVIALAALEPELLVTGHGHAMQGEEMRVALRTLAGDFSRLAVPRDGVYVSRPATARDGSAYPPPKEQTR
jgi:glyoxylase-like metal-dependent hydrolase (beta-lactamase superfamily II)